MKNINFKEKTLAGISDFIKKEIPFDKIKKNGGVYETSSIEKDFFGDDITIGVTYEDIEWDESLEPRYYYNIFVGNKYIDLGEECIGYPHDEIPISTLTSIKKEICKFLD